MASKQDFQKLADWALQPSTHPNYKRVVGAHVLKNPTDAESGGAAAYEGFLTFTPSHHDSNYLPEHFSGSLLYEGGVHRVTVGMAVGRNYATAGFNWTFNGRYDELDVQDLIQEGESVLYLYFGVTDGGYSLHAYLYPSVRFVVPRPF
jgi:hypothetical protein